DVPVRCSGSAKEMCSVALTLTQKSTRNVGPLAAAAVTLHAGQAKTVALSLGRTGRRLLAAGQGITATLSVTQLGITVSRRALTVQSPSNRLVESPQVISHRDGSFLVTVHVPGPGTANILVTGWNDNLAHAARLLYPAPRRFVFARAHAV